MPRVFPPLPQGLGGFMYGLFPPLEHHPLSCAAFPVGSPARAATSFHPAGGRGVLCAMRDPCACVYQRTIAQVSRAFCAILAQNVGIVRKTCRAAGRRATSVSLAVGMSREGSFYAATRVRLSWHRKSFLAPLGFASFLENDNASHTKRESRCRSVLLKRSI